MHQFDSGVNLAWGLPTLPRVTRWALEYRVPALVVYLYLPIGKGTLNMYYMKGETKMCGCFWMSVYEGGGRERWEVTSQVFCQSLFAFLLLMLFQL